MNRLLTITLLVVLSSCQDSSVEEIIVHNDKGLFAADFDRNAKKILIATVNNSAQLWSNTPSTQIYKWSHSNKSNTQISKVAISKDGTVAVTAAGNDIAIWDAQNGKSIGFWKLANHITGLSVTDDGKYALVSFANRSIQLIDVKDGRSVWQASHSGYIQAIDLSSDGKLAVVGDDDKYITMWDIENSKKLFSKELESRPRYLKISPSKNLLLLSSTLQPIKILDAKSGSLIKNLTKYEGILGKLGNANYSVLTARFNKNESQVLIGSPPKNLYLWSIETGAIQGSWSIPKSSFWKPNTPLIYTVAFDETESNVYCETSEAIFYKWNIN